MPVGHIAFLGAESTSQIIRPGVAPVNEVQLAGLTANLLPAPGQYVALAVGARLCIYSPMDYEWDPVKNRSNLAKHGVDFADAVAVFEDDLALTQPDTTAEGEQRFITLGVDGFGRLLVVAFTERQPVIRIISARLATKQERKAYES